MLISDIPLKLFLPIFQVKVEALIFYSNSLSVWVSEWVEWSVWVSSPGQRILMTFKGVLNINNLDILNSNERTRGNLKEL